MSFNLDWFWFTSLAAVGVGLTALVMIIRSDLSPQDTVTMAEYEGKRLLLGGMLGMGILAASIKLIAVFVLSSFPEKTIDPLLVGKTNLGFNFLAPPPKAPLPQKPIHVVWEPLPRHVPSPTGNPTTVAKVALGRRLFNDVNLSKDRSVACASCHDLDKHAGADGRATALGVGGAQGSRNTPTVLNAAYQSKLFWDGRATSLEAQALGPLMNPIEMAMPSAQAIVDRVKESGDYKKDFKAAFPEDDPMTIRNITRAIAAFERTLVTDDAPIDHFLAGDRTALTPPQKRGMYLFRKLGCNTCHSGPNFSGASKIGRKRPFAYLRTDRLDPPQAQALNSDKGRNSQSSPFGLWRIPSLRNVALTGPYLHDGSIKTLSEAVTIMVKAQLNAALVTAEQDAALAALEWDKERSKFHEVKPKSVTPNDIADIVAFLQALSSDSYAQKLSDSETFGSVAQATELSRPDR